MMSWINSSQSLLFTCEPHIDESLMGYLMRVAELNKLRSVQPLNRLITGSYLKMPGWNDVVRLAEICGCTVAEAEGVFGLRTKSNGGEKSWWLRGHWITKPYFISSRMLAFCPACLSEKRYRPALWDLTFYRACADHEVYLHDVCHACGKKYSWLDGLVDSCSCGARLSEAELHSADQHTLFLTQLIFQKLDPDRRFTYSDGVNQALFFRLQQLSLDGLLKTIWLLGKLIQTPAARVRPTSRRLQKVSTALEIVQTAGVVLQNWPNSFEHRMEAIRLEEGTNNVSGLLARAYGGIHRYLTEEMLESEHLFLHVAYERYIRDLWKALNRPAPKAVTPQLEFEF